jgi:uncharacterized protein (TIGR02453 family)
LDFYEDLERDNSKAFWTEHKQIWETCVRDPLAALLEELEPEFGEGSLFRPYRDVRFSKDKSPYKDHQGAFVAIASGMGYYVQVAAEGLMVAGGFHAHAPDQVERLRVAVAADASGEQLAALLDDLRRAKLTVGGETLKTVPRGYPREHPRAELLKHKSLTAARQFGAPAWLSKPSTKKQVAEAWRAMRPLNDWLSEHVGPSRLPRERR